MNEYEIHQLMLEIINFVGFSWSYSPLWYGYAEAHYDKSRDGGLLL